VKWARGEITINQAGPGKKDGQSIIELKDITGSNTTLKGQFGDQYLSTKLNNIFFSRLEKKPGNHLILEGLALNGEQLKLMDNNLDLSVAGYALADNRNSSFRGIHFISSGKTTVTLPSLSLTPHIRQLLDGGVTLDGVLMDKPVINIQNNKHSSQEENKKNRLPGMDINQLVLNQPSISYTSATDSGELKINWHGELNPAASLKAGNIHTHEGHTSISDLSLYLTNLFYTSPNGKIFNTGKGSLAAQLKNIRLEQEAEQPLDWSGMITSLATKDRRLDSMGKTNG